MEEKGDMICVGGGVAGESEVGALQPRETGTAEVCAVRQPIISAGSCELGA